MIIERMSEIQTAHIDVIIPAYNEAVRLSDHLPQVFEWLRACTIHGEVLVVDDGSDDDTAGVVQACIRKASGGTAGRRAGRLVRSPENSGKGHAVRQGFAAAAGRWVLVTDADLLALVRAVTGKVVKEKRIVDLTDLAVVTGIRVIPTASVRLVLDGKEYIASETGLGPVDAAIKAVQKLTADLVNVKLKEYRLEAATGGSDAMGEVVIKVEDKEGNVVSARAAHEDIVMASVEAMIDGINKSLLRSRNRRT